VVFLGAGDSRSFAPDCFAWRHTYGNPTLLAEASMTIDKTAEDRDKERNAAADAALRDPTL
jgi:hypothetical protein